MIPERVQLTDDLNGERAIAVHCERCNWRGKDKDPGSGEVDAGVTICPGCKKGRVSYTFWPGVRCGGCGKLDHTQPLEDATGSYCSRICLLQAEYARSLSKKETQT